jgi:hypothetical protein
MARRRVSLKESFKLAGSAASGGSDIDTSLLATIVFGIWWWIAGVPKDKES